MGTLGTGYAPISSPFVTNQVSFERDLGAIRGQLWNNLLIILRDLGFCLDNKNFPTFLTNLSNLDLGLGIGQTQVLGIYKEVQRNYQNFLIISANYVQLCINLVSILSQLPPFRDPFWTNLGGFGDNQRAVWEQLRDNYGAIS